MKPFRIPGPFHFHKTPSRTATAGEERPGQGLAAQGGQGDSQDSDLGLLPSPLPFLFLCG